MNHREKMRYKEESDLAELYDSLFRCKVLHFLDIQLFAQESKLELDASEDDESSCTVGMLEFRIGFLQLDFGLLLNVRVRSSWFDIVRVIDIRISFRFTLQTGGDLWLDLLRICVGGAFLWLWIC